MLRFTSTAITFLATLLAISVLVILIVVASKYFSAQEVIAVSVFGSVLVLLHATHFVFSFWKDKGSGYANVFNSFFIFFLIAASYTPIYLIVLPSGWGWSMFGVTWGFVFLGIASRPWGGKITRYVSPLTFFVIDWLVVLAFIPLHQALSFEGLRFLTLGGLFYSLAFLSERESRNGEIKRFNFSYSTMLLIAGNASHFFFLWKYVLI